MVGYTARREECVGAAPCVRSPIILCSFALLHSYVSEEIYIHTKVNTSVPKISPRPLTRPVLQCMIVDDMQVIVSFFF